MTEVLVDRLQPASVMRMVLSGLGRLPVRYVDATPAGLAWARASRGLGLMAEAPAPWEGRIGDLRDERGACVFEQVTRDVRELTLRVVDERFARHPFVRALGAEYDAGLLALLLAKALAEDLHPHVAWVHAARPDVAPAPTVLLLARAAWSAALADLASVLGTDVRAYRSLAKPWGGRYLSAVRSRLRRRPPAGSAQPHTVVPATRGERGGGPRIASWFTARTVAFRRDIRSDLFWVLDAPVPRDRLLVYFDRPDLPATSADAVVLASEGARGVALAPGASSAADVPLWVPGETASRHKRRGRAAIARAFAASVVRLRRPGLFVLANSYYFMTQYAYWRDFFESWDVRVAVSPYDFTRPYAPRNLALADSGGVSVSYQWSNLREPSVEMAGCSDAMFSFGPAYEGFWRATRSPLGRVLHCGYVTDHAFEETRGAARSLRSRLEEAGARFVLCFFDENSSDSRLTPVPHERARAVYSDLLDLLAAEPDIGLVLKPGYPRTLRERLGTALWERLEAALATGRCVMLERGSYVTEQYPAEAAQAADVCAGLLMSGTASLEARLTGTPTVFLDAERLLDDPVWATGAGSVVFPDVASLADAVRAWRADPASVPGFGDLTRWAEARVAFRDGRAAERIGSYVAWLHETLAAGGTREEALAEADRRYAEAWGEGSVVPWR